MAGAPTGRGKLLLGIPIVLQVLRQADVVRQGHVKNTLTTSATRGVQQVLDNAESDSAVFIPTALVVQRPAQFLHNANLASACSRVEGSRARGATGPWVWEAQAIVQQNKFNHLALTLQLVKVDLWLVNISDKEA